MAEGGGVVVDAIRPQQPPPARARGPDFVPCEEGDSSDPQPLPSSVGRDAVPGVKHPPRQPPVGRTGQDDGKVQVGLLIGVPSGSAVKDPKLCEGDSSRGPGGAPAPNELHLQRTQEAHEARGYALALPPRQAEGAVNWA